MVLQVIKVPITVRTGTFRFVVLKIVLLIFILIVCRKVLNNTDKVLERMKEGRKRSINSIKHINFTKKAFQN
jgi:hypothetical protein